MTQLLSKIDFTDRKTQACPFAAYAEINANGGVYLEESTGFYIVTNYEIFKKLAVDNKTLSNRTGLTGVRNDDRQQELDEIYAKGGLPFRDTLVSTDPPDHVFHRALVDKVFSPARVAKMEVYLREVIDSAINTFIDSGAVDIHNALSVMVPMTVIADQIGLPREPADIQLLKRWSDAFMFRAEPFVPLERAKELAHIMCEAQQYLIKKIEEYRKLPADCMLSDLVHAEIDGRRLNLEDLVSMMFIILTGGNETTTSAISNGLIRLIGEPGLEDRLREDPSLISQFAEEVLRIDAPLQGLFRKAVVDMRIGSYHVPAGSIVVLKFGGVNHDPQKFPEPDRFDPQRANARQHVAFSAGPHFCVGHQLARSEMRFTFEHILRRMRNLRFADRPDAVLRQPHYTTFGLKHLHITFEKIPTGAGDTK